MNKRQVALLNAKTKLYKSKLDKSREVIREALGLGLKPYVAFSGGKDSTVIFNLVKEQYKDIIGIWSDDEWWLPETEEYIKSENNIIQIRTNAWHAEWFQIKGDWDGIPEFAKSINCKLTFLGLRIEENTYRRINALIKGDLYYSKTSEMWHCNPIHNWTWKDVWSYIFSNNLKYNKAYDKYDLLKIPPEQQRVGPFAVEKVLQYGQLSILKKGWKDLFNRFVEAYPEAEKYC